MQLSVDTGMALESQSGLAESCADGTLREHASVVCLTSLAPYHQAKPAHHAPSVPLAPSLDHGDQ